MFGYICVCKDELDKENFELFRAYYCTLCKSIGKYSNLSRLGLNYDITFLFILLSGIADSDKTIVNSRCMLHPWKKEKKFEFDELSDYAAAMNIILCYRKSEDDWNDERSLKSIFGKMAFSFSLKRIFKKYSRYDKEIKEKLFKLSQLEKSNCQNSDEVADCFAKLCEVIFSPDFIKDENTIKVLRWLGYNVGRWIYLLDAFDDLKKDMRENNFNPLMEKYKKIGENELRNELEITLTYTLSNISAAYDLLDVKRNDDILKNIIYSGMYGMQNKVLKITEV